MDVLRRTLRAIGAIRRLTGVLALAALAGCGAGTGDAGAIYLGIAGPINMSNGRSMKMAAEMAVEEINAAGGIHGRPLALVVKDDEAIPERAIEVATELVDDPRVIAVVGHINSAASRAAADVYNNPERGLVELSPASSSISLSDAGEWTFRVCPTDLQHAPALADWIYQRLNRRRAAVLYANDEYGRGLLEVFVRSFERQGGEVIARDPFLPALMESDNAVDPYLERAIRNRMDALVIAGQAAEGYKIIRAARRLGYTGPILGADGITSLREAGAIAEGIYITSAFLADRPTDAAQSFVRAFTERYGEVPDHRAAMSYDAVYLLARALRETGAARGGVKSMSDAVRVRRAVRDYLASVGNGTPPHEGVSGTIRFDENGDVLDKEVTVGVVKGGQLVTAS